MTAQPQQTFDIPANPASGVDVSVSGSWRHTSGEDSDTEIYRAGAYRMLAALLRSPPDETLLDQVAGLSEIDTRDGELAMAMSMLGLAARTCRPTSIEDEYHALFIGLGRGELVPYGSWYMTGYLMERPLGELRDELARLGFERSPDVREPEDHIAALYEVMSMLITESMSGEGATEEDQIAIFDRHIGPWADRFFRDLVGSQSAVFYRSVGRLGLAFMAFEERYLSMKV